MSTWTTTPDASATGPEPVDIPPARGIIGSARGAADGGKRWTESDMATQRSNLEALKARTLEMFKDQAGDPTWLRQFKAANIDAISAELPNSIDGSPRCRRAGNFRIRYAARCECR